MYRSIIVARIRPNVQQDVAKVFAESDATSLPLDLDMPGFKEISGNLRPYIHAYDEENWRTPQDAVAKEFYHWENPNR
jgi:cyclase